MLSSRPSRWWAPAVVLVLAAGCSVQRVGVRDPQPAPGSPPYDPQAERASPPAPAVEPAAASGNAAPPPTLETPQPVDFGTPAVEVQDLAPASAPSAPSASSAPPASGDAAVNPSAGPASNGAYRVQVFAGTDSGAAEHVRADVESRLGERAVVVYQAPYYKVRVGACPTSEGCTDLQARLRAAGFTTTWVVAEDAAR